MAKLIETRDLAELVEKFSIYKNIGKGAGSYYDSHLLFINALFPGVFCHNQIQFVADKDQKHVGLQPKHQCSYRTKRSIYLVIIGEIVDKVADQQGYQNTQESRHECPEGKKRYLPFDGWAQAIDQRQKAIHQDKDRHPSGCQDKPACDIVNGDVETDDPKDLIGKYEGDDGYHQQQK